MKNLLYLYQHLPAHIDPAAISIGDFAVSWYSLMYVVGFLVVWIFLAARINMGEFPYKIYKAGKNNEDSRQKKNEQKRIIADLLIWIFLGLIVGARLGYVLFYNLRFYIDNPVSIISPFDLSGKFTGIYGMSYHGGLIGSFLAAFLYSRKKSLNFYQLANFIIPAVPAGYFFGRIGNFINGELYGRMTERPWGMYFPDDDRGVLRHPSQLYEAVLEGLVLFIILWSLRSKAGLREYLLPLYIIGYAVFRISIEFFRQPDEQVGYLFKIATLGQILSLFMLISGIILIFFKKRRKVV
jgi:phosphatidylglycerol---prolipoprotein diacylglyceryl transferase